MSSSDKGRGDAPGIRQEPPPNGPASSSADNADPYANWLDRMQRARARHAAITKNLYTWSNYKNWADKMRDNWQDGPGETKAGPNGHGAHGAHNSHHAHGNGHGPYGNGSGGPNGNGNASRAHGTPHGIAPNPLRSGLLKK